MTAVPSFYIVESATRRALAEESKAATISSAALAWVNAQTAAAIRQCAAAGRRTPSGRLMAPPDGAQPSAPVVVRHPDPEAETGGRRLPERLPASAREWLAKSPEEKTIHLQHLYVSAPAINEDAMEIILEIACAGTGPYLERAKAIIERAADLANQ